MTRSSRSKGKRFDSLEQEAFLHLWRTYDRLRIEEDALFSQHDLTPQQYNALRLLRGSRPEMLATLVLQARLVSRSPDITRMLDKLEERKLISRSRPAANRRMVLVAITPAGLDLLAKLDAPVRACHARQLGHLRPAQLEQLVELLNLARAPHESDESIWRCPSAEQPNEPV